MVNLQRKPSNYSFRISTGNQSIHSHVAENHLALLLEELDGEAIAEGMLAHRRGDEPAVLATILIGELTHAVDMGHTVPLHVAEQLQLRIAADWHALAFVEDVKEVGERVHWLVMGLVVVAEDLDAGAMRVPDEGAHSAGVVGEEDGSLDGISGREGIADVELLLQLGEVAGVVVELHAVERGLGVLVAQIASDLADIVGHIDEVLAVVLDRQHGGRRRPESVVQVGIAVREPDGDGASVIEAMEDDGAGLVLLNDVLDQGGQVVDSVASVQELQIGKRGVSVER